MIKKTIILLMSLFVLIWVCPISVHAEKLKFPIVQFRLVSHDEIALRWNEIEGTDYYRIYRTDVATGKTVKYKKNVKGTEVTVKNLTAETEYIFKVAAVSEKNGEVIAEAKSRGTHVTTPKEWYYSYSATSNGSYWTYKYFKENYSKTIHKDIILKDIKYVEELLYSNGWIYFISFNSGGDYLGRIKEDGTDYEILFYIRCNYNLKSSEDYIYLYRYYYYYLDENFECEEHSIEGILYKECDTSDFYKISLKTGEVTKTDDIFELINSYFDIKNNYIYYVYCPLSYNAEKDIYYAGPYQSTKDRLTYIGENYEFYLCRIKNDGTDKEIICTFPKDLDASQMYIYNDEIYFYSKENKIKIYKMSLNGGEVQEIFSSNVNLYITDFEIVNGYIYFTNYKSHEELYYYEQDYDKGNPNAYYRLKTDGTGLTKSLNKEPCKCQ